MRARIQLAAAQRRTDRVQELPADALQQLDQQREVCTDTECTRPGASADAVTELLDVLVEGTADSLTAAQARRAVAYAS